MPIVFVSAIAQSDVDRLQGYASGAIDYVFIPVAPELLRAKVKTYVDHYRRQRELEILKRELEARVAERTIELETSMTRLAQSEERYRMLVDNANDIVATFDPKGRLTSVNPAIRAYPGLCAGGGDWEVASAPRATGTAPHTRRNPQSKAPRDSKHAVRDRGAHKGRRATDT
jgi:PAS domain-containing protein